MLFKQLKKYQEKRRHNKFLSVYNIAEKGTVLDISCGDGDFLAALHHHFPRLDLHGIDVSNESIERARGQCPYARFSVVNAESTLYRPDTFDAVFCCMSLHHYKKPEQVFSEVARVLSPEGSFYLMDFMPKYWLSQKLYNWDGCPEPYHFEKYYLKKEIVVFAKAAGFSICREKRVGLFSGKKVLVFKKGLVNVDARVPVLSKIVRRALRRPPALSEAPLKPDRWSRPSYARFRLRKAPRLWWRPEECLKNVGGVRAAEKRRRKR